VCRCTPDQIRRYRSRLSGPFLDRIDMHLEIPRLSRAAQREAPVSEPSARVAERVTAARERALARHGTANNGVSGAALEADCGRAALDDLDALVDRLGLSTRAHHRILRVARTIADLAGAERIDGAHIAEASAYRALDRATASA